MPLEQFPRFNDLGLFTEFAIANTVMEEPAPRREPALRIPNLYQSGIGFVGVISGYDHEPAAGELSGSIHLQPLLERARGRLVATLREAEIESGEAHFELDPVGDRRIYAAGFVVSASAPTRVLASQRRADGSTSQPVELELEAGHSYAGIVELDADPSLVRSVTVSLASGSGQIEVHDLFVLAYG